MRDGRPVAGRGRPFAKGNSLKPVNLLLPFTPVRARWLKGMAATQAVVALALWALSGSRTLPSPMEIVRAWIDLVQHQGTKLAHPYLSGSRMLT